MSLLNLVLVFGLMAATGLCAFRLPLAPAIWRRILLSLAALFALQLVWEGFYWQFLPAYLLLTLISLWPPTSWRLLRTFCFGALAAAFLAVWALPPVPRLTAPRGPYEVGTNIYRWVDLTRPEEATPDPRDHRNVVVQAWYPATENAQTRTAPYIDGLGRLPAYVSILPRFVWSNYHKIQTHGLLAAPLSNSRSKWPVVLFSPGYGASRAFYTSLLTDLASKGFVVLALDHPYESAVVELADQRIVGPIEDFASYGADRGAYMTAHQHLRAADLSFVLDQLHSGIESGNDISPDFLARLDLAHLSAIGHSFGGASAALALSRDARIQAAANIDGTLYGTFARTALQKPFLLLQSDPAETHHSDRYLSGNQQLFENLQAPGYRIEIRGANHFSFTDVPLFFSPPARWILSFFLGGPRDVSETHQLSADILAAFLQPSPSGQLASLEAVLRRYPNLIGGPWKQSPPSPSPSQP